MKKKALRVGENIIKLVSWTFENGLIKCISIRYVERSGDI